MFEYCKGAENAVNKLDKYDLSELLSNCFYIAEITVVDQLLDEIIRVYPELLDDLKWLTEDELCIYLEKRYGVKFAEVSYLNMVYCPKNEPISDDDLPFK